MYAQHTASAGAGLALWLKVNTETAVTVG